MSKNVDAFFSSYVGELNRIFQNIECSEFYRFIEMLEDACDRQARIFVCGNGGSAATAAHFACDINKGARSRGRFKVICLSEGLPTIMAYANDISYADIFIEQLVNFFEKGDVVIGISGSGNSENVLKAVKYANDREGVSFGLCGFGGGKLKSEAQNSIVVNSFDMQKVEDTHLVLIHCAMQWLNTN